MYASVTYDLNQASKVVNISTAGEPVLDGGWRNKLATPIFQQRVRCAQLHITANPAAPLLLSHFCHSIAFAKTCLQASGWCSMRSISKCCVIKLGCLLQ